MGFAPGGRVCVGQSCPALRHEPQDEQDQHGRGEAHERDAEADDADQLEGALVFLAQLKSVAPWKQEEIRVSQVRYDL